MTPRSLMLALLSVVFLGAATFFNDQVMKGTYLIGNFLPLIVFGGLILTALAVNPVLGRLRRGWALSGRELGVVVAIALFACHAPGRGLMHYFTTLLMMPHHHERTSPGWQAGSPTVEAADVHNWGALLQTLRGGGDTEFGRAVVADVLGRMAPDDAARVRSGGSATESALQTAVLEALCATVTSAAVVGAVSFDEAAVPLIVRREALAFARGDRGAPADVMILARSAVDAAFRDSVTPMRRGVVDLVPPAMLADPSADGAGESVDGFVSGLAKGDKRIALRDIPWGAWTRTLLFWGTLLMTVAAASAGLSLVLHRQWASHEHLPYPTVEFARTLLPGPRGERSQALTNRLFWIGMGTVFAIHMLNYAHVWWPEYVIPVKLQLDLSPLIEIFPVFKPSAWWNIFSPTIYFTAIGFAYFLAGDVSLSLGLAPYLYNLVVGILAGYGISITHAHLRANGSSFLFAGAYTALFIVVVHSGRQYYRTVFGRGLGFRMRDPVENHAVWGARVFMIGFAAFVAQVAVVGLELPLAILYAAILFMILTVMSRLLAEAGTFFLHAYFAPCALLWGFMGAMSLGREQLLIMALLSSLLLIDPREAFMPFAVSAIKLADDVKVRMGRMTAVGLLGLAIAMAVAVPTALYWQYQEGAVKTGDWWTIHGVPKFAFNLNVEAARTLSAQGNLGASDALSGFERFAHMATSREVVISFFATFSLVLLFSFLRRRFARWPLHPLIFLLLGSHQSSTLGFSFLLGWAVKSAVAKYGGPAHYQRLKPLMVGLVAGEVFAGMLPLVVGAIYYWITGTPPKAFRIMPG